VTTRYDILRQPRRTLDRPAGSAHRTGGIETLQRAHDPPVPGTRAVLEVRRQAMVGHPLHRFDDLVDALVPLVTGGQ